MQDMRRLLTIILVLAALLSFSGLVSAQDQQTTHTVQAGENLNRIARQYNTTVAAIAEANNITNPNLILVGQVLVIPGPAPVLTPTATSAVTVTATSDATAVPAGTVNDQGTRTLIL